MKRVTVLIPDDVSEEHIYYFRDGSMTGVQAYIAPDRVGNSKEVVDDGFTPNFSGLSDEEIEKVNKHIKEAMRKSAIMPLAPMSPPSRKEFEALRSRVEKLEQESKRQCARVIKMQESFSDDLK